ncbi:MAG: ABC transporter substrate-binding protein [Solirubrobacterales bacterium]|nr:ABC transporter substrate-binding protein [Solirubrobacterales bacterium]
MAMKGQPLTRIGLIAALALLLAVLLASCGGEDSDAGTEAGGDGSNEMTEVAIGTQPWIGYGPFWIADEQGFDTDHGVDIKLVNFSTDQDLESGFASGKFQAANNANNTLIRLADLGLDYKIVLMEDVSLEADAIVSCNPDIRSIDDLEGAKVAFEEFSVSDVLFRYALNEAGISFDTIDYVPIPAADAGTAAVAGRVDVAVTYQPYLQAAVEEGDNCEIIFTAGENPGLISDALAINSEFAESDPDAVVGVLQAWGDAVDFYNESTKEAQAIIAKNVGSKPGELGSTFEGVQLFDLQQSQDYLAKDYESLWADIRSIMLDQGQIESEPDVNDYLDTSFGEQALGGE